MDLTPNGNKGGRGGAHPGGKEAAQKDGNKGDISGTNAKGMQKRTANRGPNVKKGGRRQPRLKATPPDGGAVTVRFVEPTKPKEDNS